MTRFAEIWKQEVESHFVRDADGRTAFRPWGRRAYWIDSPAREQKIRRAFRHLLVATRFFFSMLLCAMLHNLVHELILKIAVWLCLGAAAAYLATGWPIEIRRLTKDLEPAPAHDRPAPRRRSFRQLAANASLSMTVFQIIVFALVAASILAQAGRVGVLSTAFFELVFFELVFLAAIGFVVALLVTKLRLQQTGELVEQSDVTERIVRARVMFGHLLLRPALFLAVGALLWLMFNFGSLR